MTKLLPSSSIQSLLLTGATGSFGRAFTRYLLSIPDGPRLRLFSRDEAKQEDMAREFPPGPRITYIIGDVRDEHRLQVAANGVGAIVHAAALKRVPAGERNAEEFQATNITGTRNVIRAALEVGATRTMLISSDKAINPRNTYGATKAAAENLMSQANLQGTSRGCIFSSVRGGNVWGSRGSVATIWKDVRASGQSLPVTGPITGTRFHLPMDYWVNFVWQAVNDMHGSDVFIPKMSSWSLGDLAQAFGGGVVNLQARYGDKEHETIIPDYESGRAIDVGWAYVVEASPEIRGVWNYSPWYGFRAPPDFVYSSDKASRLTVEELTRLVKELE